MDDTKTKPIEEDDPLLEVLKDNMFSNCGITVCIYGPTPRSSRKRFTSINSSPIVIGGNPKDPEEWREILSASDIAIGKEFKAEAESMAVLNEECCVGNPYVQDEEGNWMSREQLIHRLRNSWVETMLEKGWSPIKVMAMQQLLG